MTPDRTIHRTRSALFIHHIKYWTAIACLTTAYIAGISFAISFFSRSGAYVFGFISAAAAIIAGIRNGMFRRFSRMDAARYLDHKLQSKDRFASFVELEDAIEDPAKCGFVASQLEPLIEAAPQRIGPAFKMPRVFHAFLRGLIIPWLAVAFLHFQRRSIPPQNPAQVAALESILEKHDELPEELKEKIETLKESLEEHPLLDAPVSEALAEAAENLEQILAEGGVKKDSAEEKVIEIPTPPGSEEQPPHPTPTPSPTPTSSSAKAPPPEPQQNQDKEKSEKKEGDNKDQQSRENGEKEGKQQSQSGQQQQQQQQSQQGNGQGQGNAQGQGEGKKQSGQGSGQQQSDSTQGKKEGQEGKGQGEGSRQDKGREKEEGSRDAEAKGGEGSRQGADKKPGGGLEDTKQALDQIKKEIEKEKEQSSGGKSGGDDKNKEAQEKKGDDPEKKNDRPGGKETPDSGEKRSSEKPESGDTGGKSAMPAPGEMGKTPDFGMALSTKEQERARSQEVSVPPSDEQLDTRFTGREGESVQNRKEASPRTGLADVQLSKPETRKGGEEQYIPPEYENILSGR